MAAAINRLVILGLDGATWTVLDPMRQRGLMPNLDALLAKSAHGTLRSIIPPVTSAAWTSMMTGCGPARHGVFDHRYFDAESGQMKVNHSARVRVPTFWHLLSQAGRSVVCLNLPSTFPPLPVRGVMVSGMDAPHLDAALSGCPEFGRKLKAEVPAYDLKYFWKRAPLSVEELEENARHTATTFHARAQAGLLADREVPDWSALMVQFQNLDPFQHRAWRCLNVDETGIDDPEWNAAAALVIKGLDESIGILCELAEKRGAAILALSDHGFGPCLGRVHVNRILVDAGVARLPGLVGRLRRRGRQAADHWRLRNAKRDDPEARSTSFDLSVAAQFPFDWKRTLAFAPHQDTAAMVYLNTQRRQAGAPIVTLRQADEALDQAAAALADAKHAETGRRLFPTIIKVAETYRLDPEREGYPDLLALPDDPYWVRTKLTDRTRPTPGRGWLEADPNLPGTHRPEGIVALAAPGVVAGRTVSGHLIDIAPTILSLFGMPIPAHMEGQPLGCLPNAPASRQDAPELGLNGPHHPSFEYTAEEQAIIEQRLADLGYLE